MSSAPFTPSHCKEIIFTYHEPDGAPGFSIGPISLTLRAGEVVFLAGGNGSGKSTFVKLLVGLYPASGRVMIDGNPVSLSGHRHLFSAVFSDFHLFDALYGVERPDGTRIRDMLERMRLTGKTDYADGRFTTPRDSAGVWPSWSPCRRIGRFWCSTNGPRTKIRDSGDGSMRNCSPP